LFFSFPLCVFQVNGYCDLDRLSIELLILDSILLPDELQISTPQGQLKSGNPLDNPNYTVNIFTPQMPVLDTKLGGKAKLPALVTHQE